MIPTLRKNCRYRCYQFVSIKQALAFRRFYFKDYWNLVDLFIVALSIVDIVIDEVAEENWGFAGMLTDEYRKQAVSAEIDR